MRKWSHSRTSAGAMLSLDQLMDDAPDSITFENAPFEEEIIESQTYEAEQKELEAEVICLQKEIEVQETQIQNIEKFIQKSSQYVCIEELTPYVLHELVKAIYVDAPDKSSGKRRQHIHIQYDGLGFIPLNEFLTSEKA